MKLWPWLTLACCGVAFLTACERNERERDEKETEQVRREEKAREQAAKPAQEADRKAEEQRVGPDEPAARAAYAARIKEDAAELDERIAELRTMAQTATGESKHELDTALARIDQTRNALGGDISKLESKDVQDWQAVEKRIENSLNNLRKQVEDARDRWKPGRRT